ncbi:MAG: MBL fold metallo-hydrolase [Endomicrobium sp.]|jgi:metallo-beta-lactamase family protein|nr:MBL fold metallo-hydrolase [Endomicrobium sp.]
MTNPNDKNNMQKIISVIFTLLLFILSVLADVSITPYGAASTISGSCFLLEVEDSTFLVDCGLFMSDESNSIDDAELKNRQIQPELVKTKALFLTHAHLDHSGKIPLLIQKGFDGKIYSTQATKELALALFKDRNGFDLIKRKWFWSKSQKERAQKNNSIVVAHWTNGCKGNIKSVEYSKDEKFLNDLEEKENIKFLLCKNCCEEETAKIEEYFVTAKYNEDIKISDNFKVKFINAGHIPGSASFIFTVENQKILFSGDLGSGYSRFNGEFDIPETVDLIFMEATYGIGKNECGVKQYKLFRNDLEKALAAGKIVWIPALSFNRTQKILYELKLMQDEGSLPKDIPIYSISPSANGITALYQKEVEERGDGWFLNDVYQTGSILPKNTKLQIIRNYTSQMIVFSASGDMDKGKSLQLLPRLLPRRDVFVMIVNYVSPQSNAGLLLKNGKTRSGIKSLAKIKKYDVFSDHADFDGLQKWLSKQNKDVEIYIIHSNEKNTHDMVKFLKSKGWQKVNGTKIGKLIK